MESPNTDCDTVTPITEWPVVSSDSDSDKMQTISEWPPLLQSSNKMLDIQTAISKSTVKSSGQDSEIVTSITEWPVHCSNQNIDITKSSAEKSLVTSSSGGLELNTVSPITEWPVQTSNQEPLRQYLLNNNVKANCNSLDCQSPLDDTKLTAEQLLVNSLDGDLDLNTVSPIKEWPVQATNQHHHFNINNTNTDESDSHDHRHSLLTSQRKRQRDHTDSVSKCDMPPKQTRDDDEETEPLVAARVARWWRKMKHLKGKLDTASKNPNTILFHISRKEECQSFLREEMNLLRVKLQHKHRQSLAPIYAALASIEDWLEMHESALKHISEAVEICATNSEYLWLKEKLSKQCRVPQIQQQLTEGSCLENLVFPQPEEVDRVPCQHLIVEEFKKQYKKKNRPVIIEGIVSSMTEQVWNLAFIKSMAGSTKVPVKRRVPGSVEWAKLEEERTITVAEHVENIEKGESVDYLFDWSLPLHCPQLADKINVPKYFADNFLTHTSPESLYHNSWPSLFVAPPGVISDLHIDAFASSFWMALFEGEKRWTFFSEQDVPLLYPRYRYSLDPVFSVDLSKPDLDRYPLLALTKPKQCILKPGDLLFVPSGCPHFVENLTASVAVSSNYVDETNYDKVCKELRVSGLLDARAAELRTQLLSNEFVKRFIPDRAFIHPNTEIS